MKASNLSAVLMAAAVSFTCLPAPATAAGRVVAFAHASPPGTIVVHTGQRRLYLLLGDGEALSFKVGVGRPERQWTGKSVIDGKFIRPNWAPPAAIRRLRPGLPDVIPAGSPRNPMGAAAMTLSGVRLSPTRCPSRSHLAIR